MITTCKDCAHVEVCGKRIMWQKFPELCNVENLATCCDFFTDRSRFVELPTARKIKHTPDIDKMREFQKLGLGKGMSERSVFWTCSNCELWVSLAYKFCPNCGAKFEVEQVLKERG